MTEERTTPLRERMIEDMRIRGMGDKVQKAQMRAIKDVAVSGERPSVREASAPLWSQSSVETSAAIRPPHSAISVHLGSAVQPDSVSGTLAT